MKTLTEQLSLTRFLFNLIQSKNLIAFISRATFALLLCTAMFSCNKDNIKVKDDSSALAGLKDNKLVELVDKSTLESIVANRIKQDSPIGVATKPFTLSDTHIEMSGNYCYLYSTMSFSNEPSQIVAIELKRLNKNEQKAKANVFSIFVEQQPVDFPEWGEEGGIKHACIGNNCRSCAFTYGRDGKIIGCDCKDSGSIFGGQPAYCNHSIIEG